MAFRLFGLIAVLLALLGGSAAAETIKIGIVLTLSGPNAQPGFQIDKGIALFMKEHGKDLPPGVDVELIRRDDTGPNPEVAKRLAQELIVRDHVQFLAGVVYSPNAIAMAPLTAESKTPLVIMSAAGSAITTLSPYIVRVSTTLWQTSYPMGQWAAKQGWKQAYIAVSDYAPGHDAEAAFTKAFTEGGGQILGSVRLPLANPDFVPFLQRVKDAQADVAFIFVPGGKQAGAIMQAWGDLGLRDSHTKLVTTEDVVTDEELPSMGDVPLGVISAGVYSSAATRPENEAFLAAWRREYGDTAIANYNAVFGWDGMTAIFDVIRQTKGKFTGDEAMAILKTWQDPKSPRGPIAIDPATRDIVENVYIRRTEKQADGTLANVEFETVPQVKDPWKEFNPPK
jgi:branched-chain amino acid transport system substrate-binding protein